MYMIVIKKQAKKKLQSLNVTTRIKITEQIVVLANNPDSNDLDIKKMQGRADYRLRVGQWRIIFNRDDEIKIVSIEKIGARGDCIQMSLQIIKSVTGKAEYVLLPIHAYEVLKPQIKKLLQAHKEEEYGAFIPEDYVSNPAALLRIKACITQKDLAKVLEVSQAYISKLESQETVSRKALHQVKQAILLSQSQKSNL